MILWYEKVRILLLQGAIPDFYQLADDIGRTALAADMGMNLRTLRRRVVDPGKWTVAELSKLADLLKVDYEVLSKLAHLLSNKRKGKK